MTVVDGRKIGGWGGKLMQRIVVSVWIVGVVIDGLIICLEKMLR